MRTTGSQVVLEEWGPAPAGCMLVAVSTGRKPRLLALAWARGSSQLLRQTQRPPHASLVSSRSSVSQRRLCCRVVYPRRRFVPIRAKDLCQFAFRRAQAPSAPLLHLKNHYLRRRAAVRTHQAKILKLHPTRHFAVLSWTTAKFQLLEPSLEDEMTDFDAQVFENIGEQHVNVSVFLCLWTEIREGNPTGYCTADCCPTWS